MAVDCRVPHLIAHDAGRGTTIAIDPVPMSAGTRSSRIRVALRNIVLSLGSLALLVFVLASIDGRVSRVLHAVPHATESAGELTSEGGVVRQTSSLVVGIVKEESAAHAPLVMFSFVAVVLLAAMLKT